MTAPAHSAKRPLPPQGPISPPRRQARSRHRTFRLSTLARIPHPRRMAAASGHARPGAGHAAADGGSQRDASQRDAAQRDAAHFRSGAFRSIGGISSDVRRGCSVMPPAPGRRVGGRAKPGAPYRETCTGPPHGGPAIPDSSRLTGHRPKPGSTAARARPGRATCARRGPGWAIPDFPVGTANPWMAVRGPSSVRAAPTTARRLAAERQLRRTADTNPALEAKRQSNLVPDERNSARQAGIASAPRFSQRKYPSWPGLSRPPTQRRSGRDTTGLA
jgi:hypothetical protein